MNSDQFYTPQSRASAEITIKASRFLAMLAPVENKEEAEQILSVIANQHPTANHHCYAYRIGSGDRCLFKADDNGEPGNSAGKPILQALETRNVADAILIVTRYFGGTKLGIGGLIRAYSAAAFAVLDLCKLRLVEPMNEFTMTFPYETTGAVHQAIHQFECEIIKTSYDTKTRMVIKVAQRSVKKLQKTLRDMTRGEISIE